MNVYFLFLESLGTPELMLIALVALIVFGPRKLPQMGRTIGKYTAEFRRASGEFRQTWEREVQMVEFEEKSAKGDSIVPPQSENLADKQGVVENTIGRNGSRRVKTNENGFADDAENIIAPPEVRALSREDFDAFSNKTPETSETDQTPEVIETAPNSKREWL